MAYEKLNLAKGDIFKAEHVAHMEEGIAHNDEKYVELSEEIGKRTGAFEPMRGDVPLVFFGAPLAQTKDYIIMSFVYVSKTFVFKGYCKTKAQGTSSMAYAKKNQTVEIYYDPECTVPAYIDFMGWGLQHKFNFKANWIDITHARNLCGDLIWSDVVASRPDYDALPELLRMSPNNGAVDGFPVRVYAGGVYQGRYTLNIPKGDWMANMDEDNLNHCILCGENYVSGCFRAPALIDESDWSDELHKVVPENIKTRWNEVIGFVMNSADDEFKANLGNYFDVPSLIDYNIFAIASCGLDSMGKNQIYLTYDGRKWYASMYDMDSTWGLYWDGTRFVEATYSRKNYEDYVADREGNLLYIRLEKLFHEEIKARWEVLSSGPLSYSHIMRRFEEFVGIVPPHIVAEDYAATTGNGEFTGIPSKETNNIQQIRAFAKARLEYTDGYINALPNVYIPDADTTITWSDEANKQVGSDGVVINGGNYMTNAIPVGENTSAKLKNIDGASFTYLTIYQYDANMEYICRTESGESTNQVEAGFTANTAYVYFSVFPNNVATNNKPAEQIAVVFSDELWSESANGMISLTTGFYSEGTNYVTLKPIAVNGGKTAKIENTNGASYIYLTIAQYDANDAFIKKNEDGSGLSAYAVTLEDNAAYVRFSAYPNALATNNDPENQLVITVN